MSIDKIDNDARLYTDIQGLEQLHGKYKSDPQAVKKQVAQQFESLLVQMVMRSMRDANKSFSSDLLSSNDMDFYQEMFDKQLSLSLSTHGLGVAKMIEDNIDAMQGQPKAPPATKQNQPNFDIDPAKQIVSTTKAPALPISQESLSERESTLINPLTSNTQKTFDNPKAFVTALWSSAKKAAASIGVSPTVLIAQAALETDWGKKVLNHNLFNIKADPQWKKASTNVASLESKNGVLVKENANFRAYGSVDESFEDYAHFVKTNQRYSGALTKVNDGAAYVNALQTAGYATDQQYAKKVMQIHDSMHFKNLVFGLK